MIHRPGVMSGGGDSPICFNIPREDLKLEVNNPPMAQAAVFTEIGKVSLCAGNKHAWVQDFCDACRRCIRDCPPAAFYDTPRNHENGLITVLDNAKCFPYFIAYHGCSICIKVCPFNQQDYDKIKRGFLDKSEGNRVGGGLTAPVLPHHRTYSSYPAVSSTIVPQHTSQKGSQVTHPFH